jgi:hypothetical protein
MIEELPKLDYLHNSGAEKKQDMLIPDFHCKIMNKI